MTFFIGHISALRYLLAHRMPRGKGPLPQRLSPTKAKPQPGNTTSWATIRKAELPLGVSSSRIHVNVASVEDRRPSAAIAAHMWNAPGRYPYLRIDEQFCVLSPEACFLQLSLCLDFAQLVELGFLLCGSYVPNSVSAQRRKNLEPLTTVERLTKTVAQAVGYPGSTKALTALHFVQPGSASAMESKIGTALSLTTQRGGCGLKPLLNESIALSSQAQGFDWSRSRTPDFFWPEHMIALDYDSTEWHDETARADYDERRRNELAAMGIGSLTCRAKDFRNAMGMQQLFGQLAAALGKTASKTKDYQTKQEHLFWVLFGKGRWELDQEPPKRRKSPKPSDAKAGADTSAKPREAKQAALEAKPPLNEHTIPENNAYEVFILP